MHTAKPQPIEGNPLHTIIPEKIGDYTVHIRQHIQPALEKTIILVHGIGVSSNYYIPLAQELSNNFNVITIDLPGYGKTPKPASPLTIKQLAEVVAALVTTRNLQNVTLAGHSMGCQIIAHTNMLLTNKVTALVLISPTVNKKERTVFKQALRLGQDTFHETPTVNAIIFSDYLRMGITRYIKTSGHMVNDLIEETLRNSTTQTLILRGEKDRIVPRDWVMHLKTVNLNHSLIEVPDAPHAFHYTYAKQTAKLCVEFIET